MAHAIFKGTIALGLVNIPIKVSVAARAEGVSFNMLHTKCRSRVSMKTWCPECDVEIERKDTMKGYEFAPGNFVTVTPEELKAAEPESSRIIEIERLVDTSEVDPILFESSYYLEPEAAGRKGYKLLYEALVAEGQWAVARVTMSGREHIIVLRPHQECLVFHTLFFSHEVRSAPNVGLDGIEIKPQELALAQQLLRVNTGEFEHASYLDHYQLQVADMLTAKQQGQKIVLPEKRKEPVASSDLLAALAASLGKNTPPTPPAKKRRVA